MPIPEFETVERPVRKQAEQPQPSRHPKRELKPGYRWKFNGTGEPINKQNGAYILGRDLEILEDNSIKSFSHKNKHFFVL